MGPNIARVVIKGVQYKFVTITTHNGLAHVYVYDPKNENKALVFLASEIERYD